MPPAVNGLIAHNVTLCDPNRYKPEGHRPRSAAIMPEHVRAVAHRAYAKGACGLSSFNVYFRWWAYADHLTPLGKLVLPDNVTRGTRSYLYLRSSGFTMNKCDLLALRVPVENGERRSLPFQIHDALNDGDAFLRFRMRGGEPLDNLNIFLNDNRISSERLTQVLDEATRCRLLEYALVPGDLRDGDNMLSFSLDGAGTDETIIREIEIAVYPRGIA